MSEQVDARCLTCGAPIAKGPGLCDDCAGRQKKPRSRRGPWGSIGIFVLGLVIGWFLGPVPLPGSQPSQPARHAQPSQPKATVTSPPASTPKAAVPAAAPKPSATPAPAATPKPTVPEDPKIVALQERLNDAGQSVSVTGHMDVATKNAVIGFQKSHGLTPNGVVGSQTREALIRAAGHSASTPQGPPMGAKLLLTDHVTYEYGYVKVTGTLKNVGDANAFSPIITMKVYDDSGQTLLAQNEGIYPAGQFFTHMKPGVSAGFEGKAHVPGEPGSVRVNVSVDKYPYDEVGK